MKYFFSLLLFSFSFFFCKNTTFAQNAGLKDANFYFQEAKKALQNNNSKEYLQNMQIADSLRPLNPTLLYHLARAYAWQGQAAQANMALRKCAGMNANIEPAKDTLFAKIMQDADFQNFTKILEGHKMPVNQSKLAFSISEKDSHIESVAYDPKTKTHYMASIRKRKILQRTAGGTLSDFIGEAQDGLDAVLGLKVDPKNKLLWVCSTVTKEMQNFDPKREGQTAVFCYDLRTRKLVKKYELKVEGETHFFGDLALHPSGDVYISDSAFPAIYRISAKKQTLEKYIQSDQWRSLQGITFSENGRFMFLADYSSGVYRIDTQADSPKAEPIPYPTEQYSLKGTDGLYFYKNGLLAIQNGVNPFRVVYLSLDKNFQKITQRKVLENNNPALNEPTLGVLIGKRFQYVANSSWGAYDQKGNLMPEKLSDILIYEIDLEK